MVELLTALVVIPSVFAVLQRRAAVGSPSIDPDDPGSRHYDRGQAEPLPAGG